MAESVSKESVMAFWAKVDVRKPDDCWPWTGARTPKGYGNLTVNGKSWKAHRFAWHIAHFPIPDGYRVCHACDDPPCCNPGHLLLGKALANTTDMITKGRGEFRKNKAIGTRNTNAKLNDVAVREIRHEYCKGVLSQSDLAKLYGVTQPTIGYIIRCETWRHV
jgi:hypothetical protein